MKKYIYLFILAILCSVYVSASHLVGSQLYYDYLGNNSYKISLILYRNCSGPNSAAYGNVEYVQIFDTAGNYIDSLALPKPPTDTVPAQSNGCYTNITYCLEVADYNGTITLPPIPGGYILAYQRCCWNSTVTNISANTGATYINAIPDSGTFSGVNSRPRFNRIYSSINPIDTFFSINLSATDPDGDSLVYSFTNAHDGASSVCPDPSPAASGSGCNTWASPPPYASVAYIFPYSAVYPIDSSVTIDPHTGTLSGTVSQAGTYLVAIAANEYRNGILIGNTPINFLFTFTNCDTIVPPSGIQEPSIQNIKAYSSNGTVITDFSTLQVRPERIAFFDLVGRQISGDMSNDGYVYTANFASMPTQCIIESIQLSDGTTLNKKLMIQGK